MKPKHKIDLNSFLEKMLSGTLESSEKDELYAYISSTYHDKGLDDLMQKHWVELESANMGEDNRKMRQLKTKIWTTISGEQKSSRTLEPVRRIGWKTHLIRIAAVLFIPLFIASAYLFYKLEQKSGIIDEQVVMQQVFATPGSRVHFKLPDQTQVWLNSGSSLEFPINLNKQRQRQVKLTGQGYFEVTHDAQHPFLVETGELNIKVLGTSFDVSSYSNDKIMSSTLEDGCIVLLNPNGKEIGRLVPGEQASLNKETRELLVQKVDTRLITSWKDGRLIFKNTPLADVAHKLGRWYNCSVVVSPKLLNSDIQYTATIQDETLGEVLQMIEISTSVKTKIKDRNVTIE